MIELLAQAQEVAQTASDINPSGAAQVAQGISGSIQGGLGCLGAAIGLSLIHI